MSQRSPSSPSESSTLVSVKLNTLLRFKGLLLSSFCKPCFFRLASSGNTTSSIPESYYQIRGTEDVQLSGKGCSLHPRLSRRFLHISGNRQIVHLVHDHRNPTTFVVGIMLSGKNTLMSTHRLISTRFY